MSELRVNYRHAERLIPSPLQADAEFAVAAAPTSDAGSTATSVRMAILREMFLRGWPDRVPVALRESKLSVSSVKERTGLCVQFGNFARTYADLLKLEALRRGDHIDAAILIVPSDGLARRLGSNLARFSRLERELRVFQSVLECPILVLGVT